MTNLNATVLGALAVASKAFGVWFVFWAIRRKGEFDHPLNRNAKLVRWTIVVASFAATAQLRRPDAWAYRSIALTIGLAFYCWPNFAYHLTNLVGRRETKPLNYESEVNE